MDTHPGFLRDALVRPDRANDLEEMVRSLFARRHLRTLGNSQEKMWMVAEFVQRMRGWSVAFQGLSTKMEGPIPFGLGHCTIKDGRLVAVANPIPMHHPEAFARVVSEFVQPGALCGVQATDSSAAYGWRLTAVDAIEPLEDDKVATLS